MPKMRPPYPTVFRQQMVELPRECEASAQAIRNWGAQADRDAGERTEERVELRRLSRENRRRREEGEILAIATAWFARET